MCGVIKLEDPIYPDLLKSIHNPPKQLFYKGNYSLDLFKDCLSIVGSRRMSSYGRRVVNDLIPTCVEAGITIVSGFMYGVDAEAHMSALRVLGKTVAVLPCGIDRIHPYSNSEIYWQIIENGGLILSEYPGDTMPQLWTYPLRNRIVAGLSKATLIVEAGEKSGSLITANLALQEGREVCAIPGSIYSGISIGTNKLLADGAIPILSADDLLTLYDKHLISSKHALELDTLSQKIVDELNVASIGVDELCRNMSTDVATLNSKITELLLQGVLVEKGGLYYVGTH